MATPAYWPTLELFGWRDRGERLHQLTREGRWAEMPGLITDEMLDELVPTAPYAGIADVLRERYAGVGHSLTFPLPEDPAQDRELAKVIASLQG